MSGLLLFTLKILKVYSWRSKDFGRSACSVGSS